MGNTIVVDGVEYPVDGVPPGQEAEVQASLEQFAAVETETDVQAALEQFAAEIPAEADALAGAETPADTSADNVAVLEAENAQLQDKAFTNPVNEELQDAIAKRDEELQRLSSRLAEVEAKLATANSYAASIEGALADATAMRKAATDDYVALRGYTDELEKVAALRDKQLRDMQTARVDKDASEGETVSEPKDSMGLPIVAGLE